MKRIETKRGLNLFATVNPGSGIVDADTDKVALLGVDYPGLKPVIAIAQGERVRLGQTLVTDRTTPEVRFCAPGSGVVTAVHRGPRRSLLSIVINLEGDDEEPVDAATLSQSKTNAGVRQLMLAAGLWPALRRRPFDKVPRPVETCDNLFVTAMDTNPFAPDAHATIVRHRQAFDTGLARLTLLGGHTFLCTGDSGLHEPDIDNLTTVQFVGAHPAGLPGTHIGCLTPAASNAWHIGYQDVIALGYLCLTGHQWVYREVSTGGPGTQPQLLRTRSGASTAALVSPSEPSAVVVSGSILSGRPVSLATAFLGRYHNQVTVLAPLDAADFGGRGWSAALSGMFSRPRRSPWELDAKPTSSSGMLPVEAFESVWPFDSPVAALLRALLTDDAGLAARLGANFLAEEDMALCSYICPAKQDYGKALRTVLDSIERGD